MLDFLIRIAWGTTLVIFLVAEQHHPCSAAPTGTDIVEPGGTADEVENTGDPVEDGDGATPGAAETPEPVVDRTKAAATCKNVVAGIGSSDFSALESLADEKRTSLMGGPIAQDALTCLAIANDSTRYCDVLPEQAKKACLDWRTRATELEGLPKDQLKAHLIHKTCLADSPKADCDKMREAMTAGKADMCKDLSDATFRDFCAALVGSDPAKCKAISAADTRSLCEAFASNDPDRCPKDSQDCRNMAGAFKSFEQDGLAGIGTIDPVTAAAVKGKEACTPLLADLEKVCIGEE